MRIIGFVTILPLAMATVFARAPATAPQKDAEKNDRNSGLNARSKAPKNKTDLSILRIKTSLMFVLGAAIFNLAMFAPFFYLTSYAIHIGISVSLAFYLLSVLNGASLFGRILVGVLADKFRPFNLICIFAVSSAVIGFCWTTATSMGGLVVWSIAYGFTSGVSAQIDQTVHGPATYLSL
jgi:predicted MFS family arabinose efflux permease